MTQERDPIERIKKLVVLSHGLATEKELKDMEKEIRKEVDDVIAIAKAAFSSSSLQFLPAFLESCPNLKNLVLDFSVSTESEQINLTNVPRCLTSTLEYVEIKKLIMREETWIKLANYFLENASVLKKLSVSFTDSPMANKDLDICQELLTSIKRSRICQVFIS